MISLNITDTKSFMSNLLIKDIFDRFLLVSADISTANTFTINGELNKPFFSDDELNSLKDTRYSFWCSIKPFCYSLIKGNKVPLSMKIVFMLSEYDADAFLCTPDLSSYSQDISGLFINVRYSNGVVNIVTGTALKSFTLDKTLEHAFDNYVRCFLDEAGINFEEL